jgi:uncharacterized RDD family membrane protein YckC
MDKYKTFSKRFYAGLLDGLVLLPAGFLDYLVIESKNTAVIATGTVFSYCLFFVYSVYFHWSTGQTLGKKWMGIRVIDKSEVRLLTLKQSFMRDSIYMLLQVIGLVILVSQIIELGEYPLDGSAIKSYLDWLSMLWFLLEIATILTNRRRRAIHDFLAGSVVIRDEFWNNGGGINAKLI